MTAGLHRRLLLALALLGALMAPRPCRGHDPELVDLEDEDGKRLRWRTWRPPLDLHPLSRT